MPDTPNHEYNTPKEGKTDWHIPLNRNFEKIDTDVEIRDTEANKDDYKPKKGAKYEATDSGAVYYGNGSSWILADREVKSLSTESESIGASKKIVEDEGEDISKSVEEAIKQGYSYIEIAGGKDQRVYEWNRDLVIKPSNHDHGLSIVLNYGTRVNYTGSNYPITWDASNSINLQLEGSVFSLIGGDWRASSDPSGWIRLIDCVNATVNPALIRGFRNRNSNCKTIHLETTSDGFCEDNDIRAYIQGPDIGLTSSAATKSSSFQDNRVDLEVSRPRVCGMDLVGDWSDSHFNEFKAVLSSDAEGGVRLDGIFRGTVFTAPEVEGHSGQAAYYVDSNADDVVQGPLIVGGNMKYIPEVVSNKGSGVRIDSSRVMNGRGGITLEYRNSSESNQVAIRNTGILVGQSGNPKMRMNPETGDIIIEGKITEEGSVSGEFPGE